MMLRNSSLEEVKRNINLQIDQSKKDKVTTNNMNQNMSNNQTTTNLQIRNFNSNTLGINTMAHKK